MIESKHLILEGIHYRTGEAVRVGIKNGTIHSVTRMEPGADSRAGQVQPGYHGGATRVPLPVIAPGMTELQVNGFMGVDFNDGSLTPEGLEKACLELLKSGVTRFCPTVITGPPERTQRLLRTLARAATGSGPRAEEGGSSTGEDSFAGREGRNGNDTTGEIVERLAARMIGGIHVEGPFISKEDGPRGAHPREHCLDPDTGLIEQWQEAAGGMIRILTLAPELPGAVPLIRRCVDLGIRVAIGHTACNAGQLKAAVDAGAVLSTHLGNGAHSVLPRHPNYIWDQLAEDRLWASMIADGFHLPDSVLKVFIRVKGEKAILVSDAMSYSGLKPGLYRSPATGSFRVTREGKLHVEGQPGTLAGSASKLIDGVRRIARLAGPGYAWDMASVHPSRLMNSDQPSGIEAGAPADLVLLDPESLEINGVYQSGVRFIP